MKDKIVISRHSYRTSLFDSSLAMQMDCVDLGIMDVIGAMVAAIGSRGLLKIYDKIFSYILKQQ